MGILGVVIKMPNSDYERFFSEDTDSTNGYVLNRLMFDNVNDASDGKPGIQRAIHNVYRSILDDFILSGCVVSGSGLTSGWVNVSGAVYQMEAITDISVHASNGQVLTVNTSGAFEGRSPAASMDGYCIVAYNDGGTFYTIGNRLNNSYRDFTLQNVRVIDGTIELQDLDDLDATLAKITKGIGTYGQFILGGITGGSPYNAIVMTGDPSGASIQFSGSASADSVLMKHTSDDLAFYNNSSVQKFALLNFNTSNSELKVGGSGVSGTSKLSLQNSTDQTEITLSSDDLMLDNGDNIYLRDIDATGTNVRFDLTNKKILPATSATWELGGASNTWKTAYIDALGKALSAGSNKITYLANGTAASDAVNYGQFAYPTVRRVFYPNMIPHETQTGAEFSIDPSLASIGGNLFGWKRKSPNIVFIGCTFTTPIDCRGSGGLSIKIPHGGSGNITVFISQNGTSIYDEAIGGTGTLTINSTGTPTAGSTKFGLRIQFNDTTHYVEEVRVEYTAKNV